LHSSLQFSNFARNNNISVVSHSDITYKIDSTKIVNWIPDFQHVHLPDMFTSQEIKYRNEKNKKIINYCDVLIVSSHDSLKDLHAFHPDAIYKSRVLNFVAQPSQEIFQDKDNCALFQKYKIQPKFFFLPNQFWKHKNHMVVFKAINLLKQRNKNVVLICCGLMDDYRNNDHVNTLMSYIKQNNLNENVKCLGLIPYEDLCGLLRNSVAVINPSLFEGWSTTVEECKSVGKSIILSNIGVHREQAPPAGEYFDPHEFEALADILWQKWSQSDGGPELELEQQANYALKQRTLKFAETYQGIVMDALQI